MLQLLSKLIKGKFTSMSEEQPVTDSNQQSTDSNPPLTSDSVESVAAATPLVSTPSHSLSNDEVQEPTTPTPPVTNQSALFIEAYDCAKNNHNWNKVSSAISNHPEWLTQVPQGRRWTMLHQVVYCGNVSHLNEVLAYQLSNEGFRLLCKALDDKTIREVAAERAHVHPQMLRRIERLVAIDQLLYNAKDGKWELVRQFLRQQPDIVNEKPPYRKYYLAHFLATIGQLDMFKDLSNICEFRLDLIADTKTINQIARENNHIEFAEHIENLCPNINEVTGNNDQDSPAATASTPPDPTDSHFFSQGFSDNPGIMIFSLNPNSFGSMFLSQDETSSFPSHFSQHSTNDLHFATHSMFQGHSPTAMALTTTNSHHTGVHEENEHGNVLQPKPSVPPVMTDEQQAAYEKNVMENVKKFSAENLINAVTCCITKAILRDPVVAADGFTYEREAIVNWFEHSSRSPMTNNELHSLELKPNHAIKSILQSLAESNKEETKLDEKPKVNGENAK